MERSRHLLATGEETIEVTYGITSRDPDRATATQLLQWTRAYWGIENGLHHRSIYPAGFEHVKEKETEP